MTKKLILYSSMLLLVPNIIEAQYCIQVSSVNKIDKGYILTQAKNRVFQNKPDVRVEKLGRYFTLRVGDFKHKREAHSTLKEIQRVFPHAYLRTCTQHPQRIIYSQNMQTSKKQKNSEREVEYAIHSQKNEDRYQDMEEIDTMELPPNYISE